MMDYQEFEQKTEIALINANIKLNKLHSNHMGIMNTELRMNVIEEVMNELDELWREHFDAHQSLKSNDNVVRLVKK